MTSQYVEKGFVLKLKRMFVLVFLANILVLPAQTETKERQAYLDAVKNYNSFIEHPQGHVYNVYPKNRRDELCYLSAQVVAATFHDPSFASELNSDGENKEWRRWID